MVTHQTLPCHHPRFAPAWPPPGSDPANPNSPQAPCPIFLRNSELRSPLALARLPRSDLPFRPGEFYEVLNVNISPEEPRDREEPRITLPRRQWEKIETVFPVTGLPRDSSHSGSEAVTQICCCGRSAGRCLRKCWRKRCCTRTRAMREQRPWSLDPHVDPEEDPLLDNVVLNLDKAPHTLVHAYARAHTLSLTYMRWHTDTHTQTTRHKVSAAKSGPRQLSHKLCSSLQNFFVAHSAPGWHESQRRVFLFPQALNRLQADNTCEVALLPENRRKNHYPEVLPREFASPVDNPTPFCAGTLTDKSVANNVHSVSNREAAAVNSLLSEAHGKPGTPRSALITRLLGQDHALPGELGI